MANSYWLADGEPGAWQMVLEGGEKMQNNETVTMAELDGLLQILRAAVQATHDISLGIKHYTYDQQYYTTRWCSTADGQWVKSNLPFP